MAKKKYSQPKRPTRIEEPKVTMSHRLSRGKIARAQRVLGTPTATATIEEALDLIVFRRELADGIDSAFGIPMVHAFSAKRSRKRR